MRGARMGKKRSRYNGVFAVKGKLKTSYGIDYVSSADRAEDPQDLKGLPE